MKITSRAKISLFKNRGKTIILLLLISLLGTLAIGSVIAESAVNSTVDHLRRRLSPIVALTGDSERIDELYTREQQSQGYAAYLFEFLTREQIHQIAALPYVRHYDYSIPAMPRSFDWQGYSMEEVELSFVMFQGVSRPEIIYIEDGLFELRYGRVFFAEEVPSESIDGIAPVLISHELAELNGLFVSDIFEMYAENFVLPEGANVPEGGFIGLSDEEIWEHPYNNWELKSFEFEVVGIFELTSEEAGSIDPWMRMNILNTLHTPNWRTHEMLTLELESDLEFQSVFNTDFVAAEEIHRRITMNEPFWVLYDILYFDEFQEAASEFLPDFWVFENLASTFNFVHDSVGVIRDLAHRVLLSVAGASVIVLSLLITLYLKDRRQELGIYLALGEKKIKIVIQVLIEVFVVATFGFAIAILIANMVTPQISQNMLRNELSQERRSPTVYWESQNTLEMRGFGREITIDEVMESFNVSLDARIVVIYLIGGFVTIGLSTIVPILFVLELSPKEILMSGKIE